LHGGRFFVLIQQLFIVPNFSCHADEGSIYQQGYNLGGQLFQNVESFFALNNSGYLLRKHPDPPLSLPYLLQTIGCVFFTANIHRIRNMFWRIQISG
jgi:hypothetical protein